jgi:hypothetical protein
MSSSLFVLFTGHYQGEKVKEDEMDGRSAMYRRNVIDRKFGTKTLTGRNNMRQAEVDRIILK